MTTQGQDAMKVCNLCGETYLDYIDFCFNDGEVLAAQASVLDAPEPAHLDAPPLPRRMQESQTTQASTGGQLPPTRSATPVPRSKRSLLNRPNAPASGVYSAPPDEVAPEDAPKATPGLAPSAEEVPEPRNSLPVLDSEFGGGELGGGELGGGEFGAEEPSAGRPQSRPSQVDTVPIPRKALAAAQREEPVARPQPEQRQQPASPVPAAKRHEAARAVVTEADDDPADRKRMVVVGLVVVAAIIALAGGATIAGFGLGLIGGTATSITANTDLAAPGPEVGSPAPEVAAPTPEAPEPEAVEPEPEPEPEAEAEAEAEPEPGAAQEAEPVTAVAAPAPAVAPPAPKPTQAEGDATAAVAVPKPSPAASPGADPGLGAVRIRSTPSGAKVAIDGKEAGLTPIKLDLPVGEHTVSLEVAGHEPMKQKIQISAGENELPSWTLAPVVVAPPPGPMVPVMVFFSGRVGDALLVDGKEVGELPARLELSAGPHVFEVRGAQGDFRVTRDVVSKDDGGAHIVQLAQ